MKICGIVVLYNPDTSVIDNIKTYKDYLDKLYVIDNSEKNICNIIERLKIDPKVNYISFGENKGLSVALRYAAELAISQGFEWALTMDQDSRFRENDLGKMIVLCNQNDDYSIIAPNVCSVQDCNGKEVELYTLRQEDTIETWVMTSGSLMSLKDYSLTKGFDEKLFINHIDIDYCYQLQQMGKRIFLMSNVILYQHFGNSEPRKLLWKTIYPSFAAPIRTYYLFRNQKYLEKKYGKEFKKFSHVHLWKFIVKIILYEKEKNKKLSYAYKGIIDAKKL